MLGYDRTNKHHASSQHPVGSILTWLCLPVYASGAGSELEKRKRNFDHEFQQENDVLVKKKKIKKLVSQFWKM